MNADEIVKYFKRQTTNNRWNDLDRKWFKEAATLIEQQQKEIEEKMEIGELKRDSETLRYLEVNFRTNSDNLAKWNTDIFVKFGSLQEAIDAAMQETERK